MPSLVTHLNALDFANQLVAINALMEIAQAKTTFWGSRVVEVGGFSGAVYLDEIASKILRAGRQRSDADNLSPEEQIAGIEIVRKLTDFYRVTDTQIQNSNFFTKLINWIREFHFMPYDTRFYTEEGIAENYFRGYSHERFRQCFDYVPMGERSRELPVVVEIHNTRIIQTEERIRALLLPH